MSTAYETQVTMEASEGFFAQELKIYPFDGEFIASIDLKGDVPIKSNACETVVILDRSGSMSGSVYKIVHTILPKFFENLEYDPEASFHLIAFESATVLHTIKIGELKDFKMHSAGGTFMSPAVKKLRELFEDFNKKAVTSVRVLTISDGMVSDQKKTKELGDELAEFAATCNISVNSQAVRLFTSRCQPDTTALCSLLQLNNVEKSNLTDVGAQKHHDKVAAEMSELFIKDGFDKAQSLTASRAIFYKFPWDEEAVERVSLLPGRNVFWLKDIPSETLKINDMPVKTTLQSNITLDTFHSLVNTKMDFFIDKMKILKVVNTESAKKVIQKMVEYFTRVENILVKLLPDETPLDPKNIQNRAKILKLNAIRDRKLSHFLATIANDETVASLNAQQKASYLRSVDGASKAGRGLAMRAAKKSKKSFMGGAPVLSADEIVRKQTLDMAAHFDEISSIDDKNHSVSFYSQATTLEGIRTLVEFTKDASFNKFDATEILQIINIVGVACYAPIGDFPDASTWPIKEIHVGCYVSVADIVTSYVQAGDDGDKKLMAPGINKEITSCIPIFDDFQIGAFLKKYAPSLLEFSSSIGIRRAIADVPMTFGYTIIAGIRRMFYDLNKNKSTVHVETFGKFVESAASFVGKYYDHVEELLVDQDCGIFGYYLGNHGIADLIIPLTRAYKKKKSLKIAEILRSVYSCEIWKGIAKEFKGKSNFLDMARDNLHKLLSIDIEKHKVHLKAPFEAEPDAIAFYDDFAINQEYLDALAKPLYYHNYMTLLPSFLSAAVNDTLDDIKSVPAMTKQTIVEAFDLKYSYTEFVFLNIFQALRYPSKKFRTITDAKKMKILDLKHRDEAIADVKNYVRSQFKSLYEKELKEKNRKEEEVLAASIVERITTATKLADVVTIWRDGISKNGVTYILKDSSSTGFKDLKKKLADVKAVIPLRAEIIKILLFACDDDMQIVYNSGRICYMDKIGKFKKPFLLTKTLKDWQYIEENVNGRGDHLYRIDKKNRHGHGNDIKSYYGLGYKTLLEYFKTLTDEEMYQYIDLHKGCCDGWKNRELYYEWKSSQEPPAKKSKKKKKKKKKKVVVDDKVTP